MCQGINNVNLSVPDQVYPSAPVAQIHDNSVLPVRLIPGCAAQQGHLCRLDKGHLREAESVEGQVLKTLAVFIVMLDLVGPAPARRLNDHERVILGIDLQLLEEDVTPEVVENVHILSKEERERVRAGSRSVWGGGDLASGILNLKLRDKDQICCMDGLASKLRLCML